MHLKTSFKQEIQDIFTKMILIKLVFNIIWLMVNFNRIRKFLRDKAFEIASNPKHDGYQRGLASIVYKFFDKTFNGSGIKNEIK